MILFHLKAPGWEAAGVKLFSESSTIFQYTVNTACFMEGGWYAV